MQHVKRADENRKPYPFSIAAILGEGFFDGEKQQKTTCKGDKDGRCRKPENANSHSKSIQQGKILNNSSTRFEWLHCTRYNPPKVPRSKRKRDVPTRTSRQPRVPFTPFQQATLEKKFQFDHYLTASAVNELSDTLDLQKHRIKIWFQNRRARERRETKQKSNINTE